MSDEYGANSGFKGSLVNQSGPQVDDQVDYKTGNYPPTHDTTSSGGYSSADNVWLNKVQRGRPENDNGLIGQSVSGLPLNGAVDDAKQGRDEISRENYQHESKRDSGGDNAHLNPYGEASVELKGEAEEMLASRYADSKSTQLENGAAASGNGDAGPV